MSDGESRGTAAIGGQRGRRSRLGLLARAARLAATCVLLGGCRSPAHAPSLGEVARCDFERDAAGLVPDGWSLRGEGWAAEVVRGGAAEGCACARLRRTGTDARAASPFGTLSLELPAAALRGRLVRFSARVRVARGPAGGEAALWMRVDRAGGARGFFDNMQDAPIRQAEWRRFEIVGAIEADAERIEVGLAVSGDGAAWIDVARVERLGPVEDADALRVPARLSAHPEFRRVDVRSDLLSAFHGREVRMQAVVVLPPGWTPAEDLPVCYSIPAFDGSRHDAWSIGAGLHRRMRDEGHPRLVQVFLEGTCMRGHHAFANSDNNGPWSTAFAAELLPAIEAELGLRTDASGRFLTGHSSGGWSALWLQIEHPEAFGGAWASAPDPVDFRSFSGVDLYASPNLYVGPDGAERSMVRARDGATISFREYTRRELERGATGGQMQSFESVFSPRAPDGVPLPMYDRASGSIDPAAVDAWARYDIGLRLRRDWSALGPRLQGKLHVWCGTRDDFQLDGAVRLLASELERLGSDADIDLVEGRDHLDLADPHPELWPDGMLRRIHEEMAARQRAAR